MRRVAMLLLLALVPSRSMAQTTTPEPSARAPFAIWPLVKPETGAGPRDMWHDEDQEAPPTSPRPNTGLPVIAPFMPEPATGSSAGTETRQVERWGILHECWLDCKETLTGECSKVVQDFRHNYGLTGLALMTVAVGAAAPVANTPADVNFRNWYQHHAGNSGTANSFAHVGYAFGQFWYVLPVYLTADLGGRCFDDSEIAQALSTWGNRTWRAIAVGAPAVGLLQVGLGSTRPRIGSSHWEPFQANKAVSGHAFIGSLPFFAAASMTDDRPLQALFLAGSFITPWARIQQDGHYLSQCMLGWSLGFIAMQSVLQTDTGSRRILFAPMDVPERTGMGIMFRY